MATVKPYLKNPKRGGKLRDDEVSILVKFTRSAKERFELRTGESVHPKYWDFIAKEVKRNCPDHVRLNRKISEVRSRLLSLDEQNQSIPFDQFKAIAQGHEEKKSLLSSTFDRFLKQYEQEKDPKTVQVYKGLYKSLLPFLHLTFEKLDYNFFDAWRESIIHLTDSTANRYLASLKCFLNWAVDRDIKVNPVNKKWKIRPHYREPLPLTNEEFQRLQTTMMTGTAAIGRDLLCLEAFTGQRISDLRRFDVRDVKDMVWTFNRKKGHSLKVKRVIVDFSGFSKPAYDIFKRYGFKLPKGCIDTYNSWIKEACKKAEINTLITKETWKGGKCEITTVPKWELITTHCGRKTFINLTSHIFTPEEVMEMTGIESYITLKKHYKGTGDLLMRRKKLIQMEKELRAMKGISLSQFGTVSQNK